MTRQKENKNQDERRKFLKIISVLAVVIPPLVGVPAVNLMVDSANFLSWSENPALNEQIRRQHNEILSDLLTKGTYSSSIVINRPYLWQILVSNGFWKPEKIKTIYFGSSLGMPVNSKLVGATPEPVSFINASIPAATIRDHLISFEILKKMGIKPKRVILEVDIWSLVDQHGVVSRQLKFFSQEILGDLNLISTNGSKDGNENKSNAHFKQIRHIFSPAYLQYNVGLFFEYMRQINWGSKKSNKKNSQEQINEDHSIRNKSFYSVYPDLSFSWSDRVKSRAHAQVRQVIRKKSGKYRNIKNETVPFWCFRSSVNEQRIKELEFLVELIRKSGATIEFLLLPMHPYYVEYQKELADKNKMKFTLKESLPEILKIAKKYKILVRGRYFPKKETRYFIDNSHQSFEGVRDDFNQIYWSP